MFDTSNDLSPSTRQSAIELLNEHLANAIDLQLQAKQAHWNIKGPNFVGLHDLFDRVAAQAGEFADLIAERGVALGGVARGTVQVSRAIRSCVSILWMCATGALTFERCRMGSRRSGGCAAGH